MECSSKDPPISQEVQNDFEVEHTLLTKCGDILPDFNEKPLSPIISSGASKRNNLMGSRLARKKSRVKLTDRFIENDRQRNSPIENSTSNIVPIPEFIEDSFTLSQTESLISRLEQLEEIDKYRQTVHKIMVTGGRNGDFSFKKPISPAPNKSKKIKTTHTSEKYTDAVESESKVETITKFSESNQIEIPKCSGFQTATGKTIEISDTDIRRQSKLFEDIINPSQNYEIGRNNKYAFLSKSKANESNFNDINPVLCENLNINVNATKLCTTKGKSTEYLFASSSNDQYDICAKSGKKSHPSLTQEMCESGISDTQMLCALDDALSAEDKVNSSKHDWFKGFDRKEARESETYLTRLNNFHQSFKRYTNKQINGNYKEESIFPSNSIPDGVLRDSEVKSDLREHSLSDSLFPPKKRHCRRLDYVSNSASTIQIKEEAVKERNFQRSCSSSGKSQSAMAKARNVFDDIDLNFCQNIKLPEQSCGGFSSASGKPIKISDNCLKKAKIIFDNMDLDTSKENLHKANLPRISAELTSNTNKGELLKVEVSKLEDTITNDSSSVPENSVSVRLILNTPPLIFPTACGFQTAGGNKLKISEEALRRAQESFNNAEHEQKEEPKPELNRAAGSKQNISEEAPRSAQMEFNKAALEKRVEVVEAHGFQTAGGNKLKISKEALRRAQENFNNIDHEENGVKPQFKTIARSKQKVTEEPPRALEEKNLKISEEALRRAQVGLNNIALEEKCIEVLAANGFQTAGGRNVKISESALRRAQVQFDDMATEETETGVAAAPELCTASGSKLNKSKEAQRYVSNIAREEQGFQMTSSRNVKMSNNVLNDRSPETKGAEVLTPFKTLSGPSVGNSSAKSNKRRLGVSSCKQIQIPGNKLNKAKLLFEEDFCGKSPMRSKLATAQTSTPVRQNFCSTPVKNDLVRSSNNFSSFIDSDVITPIKVNVTEKKKVDFCVSPNSKIALTSPTKGDAFDWINKLEVEKKKLEDRLRIVVERQRGLENLRKERPVCDKRLRKGILYQSKCTKPRVFLSSLTFSKKTESLGSDCDACHITPQNAENLHFQNQSRSSVTTKDGAVIIPNSEDLIGLSEIETAFKAMPGVDPRLLPAGWLGNHYKWIVWKLASYERVFPKHLDECLSVENLVQQLKYRYDREIDRAERSALRKIYEKDDAPQKRMILCVSDIKKVDVNKYELELTDGWYRIRTILDEPLSRQVTGGKIKIGTKLVTCGAELLNCDGCHPLESTDLTCLRINFNSTRRALWHAKLGYQRSPGPFSIQIGSVHPLGGVIGAVRICIVRVYPFNYFERLEGYYSVWRNKKAEELRAQEWENERCKKLEEILENVSRNFDCSQGGQNFNFAQGCGDISEISCPKTLYEIMRSSKDPDCLQEMLSPCQRRAILEYQSNLSIRKQDEMASRVSEDVEKLNLTKRNVVAVLKLLVIDARCSSDKAFNFLIWGPTESHVQILREGACFTVRNVTPKRNGDLNSNMKTVFTPEPSSPDLYDRFKRRLVQIVEFAQTTFAPDFNEFDTVGVVVQTRIEVGRQEVWLADRSGRLLLINIYEAPSTCLLLDNLKRGQATTVCNLTYHGLKDDVAQALGNHFTVVSSYSQHRHLQEGLNIFRKDLPKDTENLLKECDSKIELFRIKNSNSLCTNFEDSNEDTLVSSRLSRTDVALSLIDLDKFI